MSAPDQDQKTEEPTAKRQEKARKDGDVLKSRELLVATVSIAGCAYLWAAGSMLFEALIDLLTSGLTLTAADAREFVPAARTTRLMTALWWPMIGLFALCIVGAVAGQAMLGRVQFNMKSAKFQGGKLNPLKGLKRMFGTNALSELWKSVLKVLLTGSMGLAFLYLWIDGIGALGKRTFGAALAFSGHTLAGLLAVLCAGLAVVAMVDVPVQAKQRTKKLRMTKQEVKDEHKQSEGAPELRAAMRERQRQAAKGGARKGVEEAQMVLVNPSHFAVALRYRPGVDAAPVVSAAGRGDTALAIRELAEEFDRPVLSYPELTRAIYFTSAVGAPVRHDLFTAVAVVLAFVLDVDRRMAAAKPAVVVPKAVRFDSEGRPEE
ncbi:MAG: EscU/YscU/HrcU family type III secretion system export apparatus switch protein [Pacificimonas sp.]